MVWAWILFHFFLCFLARVVFFLYFSSSPIKSYNLQVLHSFYLGSKFDFRLIFILALPLFLLQLKSLKKRALPLQNKIFFYYSYFIILFLIIFYVSDFLHYSYLKTRLDSSVLSFLPNLDISLTMLFQSYPLVYGLFGLLGFLFVYSWLLKRTLQFLTPFFEKMRRRVFVSLLFFSFALVYGKISYYPLRWSEAFFSINQFYNHLAVNPVLYFIDTYAFSQDETFDKNKVDYYRFVIERYLKAPWSKNEDLPLRLIKARPSINNEQSIKNVVIIVMESMAYGKTSLAQNPIDTSPYLMEVAQNGHTFTQYFSPHEGTARNLFGITTSVTDVSRHQTSSRNPLVVNQRVLANQFKNYEKFYFLGGSANWANIRAVFANNIEGIQIIEEGLYKAPSVDVWGVSDLDMLLEASDHFAKTQKPFIATIQLAGFHRPYTIPNQKMNFKNIMVSEDEFKKAGFYSLEQLNSIRFADYALGEFFKKARKEKYFKDTLFVITGDHGIPDENGINISPGFHVHSLEKYHVPLVFYAPNFIKPAWDNRTAWQMDVMPTIASLVGIEHTLSTLGRDLFDSRFDDSRVAFLYDCYAPSLSYSLVKGPYYYKYLKGKGDQLFNLEGLDPAKDVQKEQPELFKEMQDLSHGFFETTRYLLYNNKK